MEIRELRVRVRNQSGKGPARRLRLENSIPAVFYGPHSEPIELVVNTPELMKILKDIGENVFLKLLIDDKSKMEKLSMIKEMQLDPLTKRLLHVDFYEIRMDHKVTFEIPIHLTGTAIGIENGGELLHLKRDVKVSCLPNILPEFISVDVKNLDVGDSILLRDIVIDDDIEILDHEDTAVAVVSAPKVAKEQTAEGAEPTESVGGKKE
jgi:large subunit ribosomal protein L25